MAYATSAGDSVGGYSGFAKFLHWLIALCVIAIIAIGIAMSNYEGPWSDSLYNTHKSLGVLILLLMVARVAYRLGHGAPPPDPTLEPWRRGASSTVHTLLYVLLVVQPILGYLANSSYGAATPFFGLFDIPPTIAEDKPLSGRLFLIHRWAGFGIALLVLMHVGAALHHYFLRRDRVLHRMLLRSIGGI
ncbi:MAG TPA: cytochrome b [Xanthobacteraceae bacterium]|nr:cytochrome b [Xanthobacteraceae bacterium]